VKMQAGAGSAPCAAACLDPCVAGAPSSQILSTPAISVVLPVRDGAATLEVALESVLASRGVSFELLCVDDGSRDATPQLLERAAARDARVRVMTRPREGIVAALNAGLD